MITYSTLTDKEVSDISLRATDRLTGNHLIRQRTDEYKNLWNEIAELMEVSPENWSDRQNDLYWCLKSKYYPDDWKNL